LATVKILYFATLRERIGLSEEELEIPARAVLVSDLIAWLRQRGPEYDSAFAAPAAVRAALDQEHVTPDTPIAGAREIAFFPPVTGG
jgi:molybdopterin synthase sulfur carrier subunit